MMRVKAAAAFSRYFNMMGFFVDCDSPQTLLTSRGLVCLLQQVPRLRSFS